MPPRRQRGFLLNPYRFAASGPSSIVVDAADFDGTNDYIRRTAAMTGQAASKTGILSFWWNTDTTAAKTAITADTNVSPTTSLFEVDLSTNVSLFLSDTTGTLFNLFSTSNPIGTGAWKHVLSSWDINASLLHLYVNDLNVKDAGSSVAGNRNAPWNTFTEWTIGDYSITDGDGSRADAGLAEFYFAPGQYLDFAVSANRQKFRTAAGKPADLGVAGALPTGVAPLIYLHLADGEAAANFATNRAGTGNFTVTGALTTRATSPSD